MRRDRVGTILCIVFLATCLVTVLYNGSIKNSTLREQPVTRFQLDSLQHAYDSLLQRSNMEYVRASTKYCNIIHNQTLVINTLTKPKY